MIAGDNHIIAFTHAMTRCEQLLTGACMTGDEDAAEEWTDWAIAISDEWNFHPDLRRSIAGAARENVITRRPCDLICMKGECDCLPPEEQ